MKEKGVNEMLYLGDIFPARREPLRQVCLVVSLLWEYNCYEKDNI